MTVFTTKTVVKNWHRRGCGSRYIVLEMVIIEGRFLSAYLARRHRGRGPRRSGREGVSKTVHTVNHTANVDTIGVLSGI